MESRGEATQHKKRQRTLPLAGNKNRPGERRGKFNLQWAGMSSEGVFRLTLSLTPFQPFPLTLPFSFFEDESIVVHCIRESFPRVFFYSSTGFFGVNIHTMSNSVVTIRRVTYVA